MNIRLFIIIRILISARFPNNDINVSELKHSFLAK